MGPCIDMTAKAAAHMAAEEVVRIVDGRSEVRIEFGVV